MRALGSLLAGCLALLAAACAADAPGAAGGSSSPMSPGVLSARETGGPAPAARSGVYRLAGAAHAAVYVPAGYDPARPAPMALVLHGSSGRGDRILKAFASLADRYGVVLLAPDSADYTWDVVANYGRTGRIARNGGFGIDARRIDEALAKAFERFNIDPDRIAAVGMSDGASYALALGEYNPGLFRRVLAFSPGLVLPPPAAERRPVFIAHGRSDRVIPVETVTNRIAPILKSAGFAVEVDLFDGGHELHAASMAKGFAWWLGSAG